MVVGVLMVWDCVVERLLVEVEVGVSEGIVINVRIEGCYEVISCVFNLILIGVISCEIYGMGCFW